MAINRALGCIDDVTRGALDPRSSSSVEQGAFNFRLSRQVHIMIKREHLRKHLRKQIIVNQKVLFPLYGKKNLRFNFEGIRGEFCHGLKEDLRSIWRISFVVNTTALS